MALTSVELCTAMSVEHSQFHSSHGHPSKAVYRDEAWNYSQKPLQFSPHGQFWRSLCRSLMHSVAQFGSLPQEWIHSSYSLSTKYKHLINFDKKYEMSSSKVTLRAVKSSSGMTQGCLQISLSHSSQPEKQFSWHGQFSMQWKNCLLHWLEHASFFVC